MTLRASLQPRTWCRAIVQNRRLILFCALVMGVSMVGGYLDVEPGESVWGTGETPITGPGDVPTSALELFQHNILLGTVALLGTFLLSGPSIGILVLNGFLIGGGIGSASANGYLLTYTILVLPHGILEIPAFWFAVTASLRVTVSLLQHLRGRTETVFTEENIENVLSLVVLTVIMLAVAAVIEIHVTTRIIGYYHNVILTL